MRRRGSAGGHDGAARAGGRRPAVPLPISA